MPFLTIRVWSREDADRRLASPAAAPHGQARRPQGPGAATGERFALTGFRRLIEERAEGQRELATESDRRSHLRVMGGVLPVM